MSTRSGASVRTSSTAWRRSCGSKNGDPQWRSESWAIRKESRDIGLRILPACGTALRAGRGRAPPARAAGSALAHRGCRAPPGRGPDPAGLEPPVVLRPHRRGQPDRSGRPAGALPGEIGAVPQPRAGGRAAADGTDPRRAGDGRRRRPRRRHGGAAAGGVRPRVPRGHDLRRTRPDGREDRSGPSGPDGRRRRDDRRAVGDASGDPTPGPQGGTVPHPDHDGGGRHGGRRARRQPPGGHRPHHGRHLRRRGRRPAPLPPARRDGRRAVVVSAAGVGPAAELPRPGGPGAPRRRGRGPKLMRLAVVGAGSWGTTVAALGTRNADHVSLWARRPPLAEAIDVSGVNADYVPGLVLDGVAATARIEEALDGADVVALAVPSHGFRSVLEAAAPFVPPSAVVLSLAKGLEQGSLKRMTEVAVEVLPGHGSEYIGVLTGPNIASEVAAGLPTASVVAMADRQAAAAVQRLFMTDTFRVYTNPDGVGCEIAGVVKNVVALAAGIAQGLGVGDNARAALITRGL